MNPEEALMSATAERAIRQLIDERVAAVARKDPAPLARRVAADVVMFDVLPPLMSHGSGPIGEKLRAWFDGYRSDIGYSVHELDVRADERLGFASFAYHVSGTLQSGGEVDMWVRATLCVELVDGEWKIVHDHESVPWDPETGQGRIDLQPTG